MERAREGIGYSLSRLFYARMGPSEKGPILALIFSTICRKNKSRSNERLCVGVYLFFRPVARQVSSALVSLTSVFGMGTGGPSPLKTPTIQELYPEN